MYVWRRGGVCSQRPEKKKALGPLEMELQGVVCHPMWILGTKVESFERIVNDFNH